MTKIFNPRHCPECGEGQIRLIKTSGRLWHYKQLDLEIPEAFELPTCDHCGEEWLDPERAACLDDLLSHIYIEELFFVWRRLSKFLLDIVPKDLWKECLVCHRVIFPKF